MFAESVSTFILSQGLKMVVPRFNGHERRSKFSKESIKKVNIRWEIRKIPTNRFQTSFLDIYSIVRIYYYLAQDFWAANFSVQ